MKKLDIIIPVYNEGDNIIDVLETFRRQVQTAFRVLICYDFETDNTLEVLRKYTGAQEVEIAYVKNQGSGVLEAVKSGFAASMAPAILVYPADDTFNAGIIDKLVERLDNGCDIVCASRFMKGGCMTGCPLLKYVLVNVAAFLLYHLARLPTHDPTNGLRMFSRRVIETFPVESQVGWSFTLELLVKTHRRGWRIEEVPALWFERKKGQSRFKVLRWLPAYLHWFFFAFATTYLGKKQAIVDGAVESRLK